MNEIWYKTLCGGKITEVTVIKETEKQITYIGKYYDGREYKQRSNKKSSYENFFKTYQQAEDFLINESLKNINDKEKSLSYAKEQHEILLKTLQENKPINNDQSN